jgi:hypothetical protein
MGRKVVADALEAGFGAALVVADEDAYVHADVARTDMIRDTVDLNALGHDVSGWLKAAHAWDVRAHGELSAALDELSEARYSHYLNKATDLSTFDLHPAVVHAIVTGDHPASAIAFYLKHALDEDWYWHSLDENPEPPVLPFVES